MAGVRLNERLSSRWRESWSGPWRRYTVLAVGRRACGIAAGQRHYVSSSMAIGTLTLHRFNGDEAFAISAATALAMTEGDLVALNLEIETDKRPLKTLPDTQMLFAQPNAEVTIRLPKKDLALLVGRQFSVPHSWDEEVGDHVSRFYYCEHEDIDDNVVEFLERKGAAFRVRWTGSTVDVNYYDGSKPPARVVVEAWFTLKGSGGPADDHPPE